MNGHLLKHIGNRFIIIVSRIIKGQGIFQLAHHHQRRHILPGMNRSLHKNLGLCLGIAQNNIIDIPSIQ